jgi:LacI family transcriptional regulator
MRQTAPERAACPHLQRRRIRSGTFLAIGALKALAHAKLAVPDAMTIVAFDDLPPGLVVDPFLAVATQPAYEIGGRAT